MELKNDPRTTKVGAKESAVVLKVGASDLPHIVVGLHHCDGCGGTGAVGYFGEFCLACNGTGMAQAD